MFQSPYFQLFRISNIFTVPPDIIVGFLALSNYSSSSIGYSISDLVILIFSSVFLYIGGLVLNDLFDIKVDRLERPNRPLPSGRIKKGKAILITVLLFSLGLALASIVNPTALGISLLMIVGIVAYNYKIKNGYFRPYLMAAIRALNVIYGASSIFDIPITSAVGSEEAWTPTSPSTSNLDPWLLLTVAACTVYNLAVSSISIVEKIIPKASILFPWMASLVLWPRQRPRLHLWRAQAHAQWRG